MNSVYRKMRLVTIGVVAAASIVAGIIAIWHLAPRDVMESTPTWIYLGILALLLGPVVTIAAWAWDRRTAQQVAAEPPDEKPIPQSPHGRHPAETRLEQVAAEECQPPRQRRPGSRHRAVRHQAQQ
jgi:hypothetical protein